MTFEERLDRIAERHEALTQTVELLSTMQQRNEQRLGQLMEAMASLVRVVEIHEHRLDDFEGRG